MRTKPRIPVLAVVLALVGVGAVAPTAQAQAPARAQAQAQVPTAVVVAASPGAVHEGGAVTARATVRTASGALVTEGSVRFAVGGLYECQSATAPVGPDGVATAVLEAVTVEDGSVHAAFQGTSAFAPSEGSTEVRVDALVAPTELRLGASGGGGQPVVLTGDGSGPWHWSCGYYDQPSEGPVSFYEGRRPLGSGVSSDWAGQPAEVEADLPVGTHQVRAAYAPGLLYSAAGAVPGYTPSSSTATVTVTATGASVTDELVLNPSFEQGTAGWAASNARLARTTRAGAPQGAAVATATRTAGTTYGLGDVQPTVVATSAGATYVASAQVAAGSSSAVGKPASLVVRERTPSGALVRETRAKTTLATAWKRLALAVRPAAEGNALSVRVEQGSAASGHAFVVDAVALRHADRLDGLPGSLTDNQTGTPWTGLTANAKRASSKQVGAALDAAALVAYLDGRGGAAGTQAVRGVVYADAGGAPGALVATTAPVTVAAGQAAGWVELRFTSPVRLAAGQYWLGLHSSGTAGVARYLSQDAPDGALRTNLDAYSDGAAASFGSASTGPKSALVHVLGG